MNPVPPALHLADWVETRDTLHQFARMLGKLRGSYMPKSKHWWHITLAVSARGLTTTPFPLAGGGVELELDLVNQVVRMNSSDGWSAAQALPGASPAGLSHWIQATLGTAGVELDPSLLAAFDSEDEQPYEVEAVARFRRALSWVDACFKRFKGGLREETSPVQVFPHHLDLAVNWFSGRQVEGADPNDEEAADEQLNFGFVTGDASVAEAYFYVTAYPQPEGWTDLALPTGAYWHTEGWTGAILPYEAVVAADDSDGLLLAYLQQVQAHGAGLMR